MASVSFWKVLGVLGQLSEDLSSALADDGKVDVSEVLTIAMHIVTKLDLDMDADTKSRVDLVIAILEEIGVVVEDNKVTVSELLTVAENVCDKLGIDLDKEGFTF